MIPLLLYSTHVASTSLLVPPALAEGDGDHVGPPTAGPAIDRGDHIDRCTSRQIGIVPQEPLLFSGSVSDNIALTDPNATSESIVRAATISCAHEFIMGLPSGYSSQLGERGASLSGGQRQRLTIHGLPVA